MALIIKNPILSGFSPDPSICRAGDDFYLVTSTFAYFPGLPIYHSKDLTRWNQIGNAIDRPGQLCFDGHQISEGLFAPTIRENSGTFYILCTLIKNGGNFILTAKDPKGPWSDPIWLKKAGGIDPSIFFDDDGKVWYCGTDSPPEGEAYPGNKEIYIHEIDLSTLAEGKVNFLGESKGIWQGALHHVIWPEAPHIYKINGWYYLLHAEGGTSLDHAVCVARAKNIQGPWEGKKSNPVLTHRFLGRNAGIINVGHADLVDDTEGNWRMVLLASRPFQGVCPLGRETFLIPVIWEDGWPLAATESGMVERQITINKERQISNKRFFENCCDRFEGRLPLHWLVLRMPVNGKDAAFSLSERKGALRLFTRKADMRGRDHPAFAGRRLRHEDWAFSAYIEFAPNAENETAGLILLQSEDYQYRFELCSDSGNLSLRLVRAAGKEDEIIIKNNLQITENKENLKGVVLGVFCEEMKLSFFYGKDQYSLVCMTDNIDARILSTEYAGGFVGTLVGVFASGNGKDIDNYADVLWAEYRGLE